MAKTKQTTTVITLDDEDGSLATILTYSKKWQRYLENSLGLRSVFVSTNGGKFYELDKKFIHLPGSL